MNSYIFYTKEGYTFQPGSDSDIPDVENLQVIGFASGKDEQAAFGNLVTGNDWLNSSSFDEIQCIQLKDGYSEKKICYFNLKS